MRPPAPGRYRRTLLERLGMHVLAKHVRSVGDQIDTVRVDWARVGIVVFILVVAIVANVVANLEFPAVLDRFPVIGAAVWVAILATAPIRRPDWSLMPSTFRGTIFLLAIGVRAVVGPVQDEG